MANGYCPALLRHIRDIAGGNSPGNKLHVAGYLAMLFCCQNSSVSPINDGFKPNGNQQTLTVAFRKRPTLDDVSTTDDCAVDRIPVKEEMELPNLSFVKSSFFISDDEIRKYCDDASQVRTLGPTRVMQEHYDLFLEHANILLKKINQMLVTSQATQFGDNVVTGSATGKVINISRDGDKFILDNGFIDIMGDIEENDFCGEPCIVGGGIFSRYTKALAMACCNSAGMDLSAAAIPRFFYDRDTQTIWGENSIGVFAPGSVKFLGFNHYAGNYGGQKGSSFYFTMPLPIADFGCNDDACLQDLVFDVQMRYIDCPEVQVIDGVSTTLNRGWQFIISKRFALWVQPTDLYEDEDELAGTNGTLLYYVMNEADDAGSYAYA